MNSPSPRLWQGLAVLALLLLPLSTSAQTNHRQGEAEPFRPTVENLTRASDVVVVARVLRNDSRWVGKKIITTSELQPLDTLKGEAVGETLQVSFLGGTVGVIRQTATHLPSLDEGEVALLFLGAPSRKTGDTSPGLRIVHEAGKIRLLQPGQPESRLTENRRLQGFLKDVADRVRQEGR